MSPKQPPNAIAPGPEGLKNALELSLDRAKADPNFAATPQIIQYQLGNQISFLKVDFSTIPPKIRYSDTNSRPAPQNIRETIARFLWEKCGEKEKLSKGKNLNEEALSRLYSENKDSILDKYFFDVSRQISRFNQSAFLSGSGEWSPDERDMTAQRALDELNNFKAPPNLSSFSIFKKDDKAHQASQNSNTHEQVPEKPQNK